MFSSLPVIVICDRLGDTGAVANVAEVGTEPFGDHPFVAEDAGVKIGDKIISIDGTTIRIYKNVQPKYGEESTLFIMHEGKRRKIVLAAIEIKIPIEQLAQ